MWLLSIRKSRSAATPASVISGVISHADSSSAGLSPASLQLVIWYVKRIVTEMSLRKSELMLYLALHARRRPRSRHCERSEAIQPTVGALRLRISGRPAAEREKRRASIRIGHNLLKYRDQGQRIQAFGDLDFVVPAFDFVVAGFDFVGEPVLIAGTAIDSAGRSTTGGGWLRSSANRSRRSPRG